MYRKCSVVTTELLIQCNQAVQDILSEESMCTQHYKGMVCVVCVCMCCVCACVVCVHGLCVCMGCVCAWVVCVHVLCVCMGCVCAWVVCVHVHMSCMNMCVHVLHVCTYMYDGPKGLFGYAIAEARQTNI